MNKIKKLIIIMVLFLIPIKADALGIVSSRISNDETAMTGDTITVSFYLSFNGISPKDINSFGIGGVVFDLEYDHDVLKYVSADASGFNSTLYEEDGEEGIYSVISGEDLLSNSCADNILYCGEYGVSIKFYVKDTNETATKVKINDVAVLGWQLTNGEHATYSEEDMDGFESAVNKVHNITIKKVEVKTEEPAEVKPSTNTDEKKAISNITTEKKEKEEVISTDSDGKSNNNYLKELDVKGYIFNFYKRNNQYDLEIDKGVNSLELEIVPEDDKATYEVIGNKDLKANNNKIEIIVTSESGKKNTYTINITYLEKENKKVNSVTILNKIKDFISNNKLYLYIGSGVILLIILISVIANKANDDKLNKKLNDL